MAHLIRRKRAVWKLLAAGASAALVLSACSDDSDNGGGGEVDSEGVATAQERFDAIGTDPELQVPDDATEFDTSEANGKTLYYINTDDQLPVSVLWRDGVIRALEPYGVNVVPFNGEGSSTQYNAGIQQAISQNADAIFNLAVDPRLVSQSITDAAEADIPVISATDGAPVAEDNEAFVEGIVAEVSYDYEQVGRLQADWFVSHTQGEGHALLITFSDQPSSDYVQRGFEEEVEELCPACEVTVEDVPASQAATRLPTLVPNVLQRDSSIDTIASIYDFATPTIESALRQANLTDRVDIGTWNAIPSVMTSLKNPESPVEMEMGAPNAIFSYAIADTVLRVLTDNEPAVWGEEDSAFMGIHSFSKESVANIDVSAYNDQLLYGVSEDEVRARFQELWGDPTQ